MNFRYPIKAYLYRGEKIVNNEIVKIGLEWDFTIRSVSRKEFMVIDIDSNSREELEDKLLELAVIEHPTTFQGEEWDWDNVYAGVVAQVIEQILSISALDGRENSPQVVERTAKYIDSKEARYDLLIMMAFNTTLDEILQMETEIWSRTVGLAYMKLKALGMDPQQLLEEQSEEDIKKAETKRKLASLPMPVVQGHPQGGVHSAGVQDVGVEQEQLMQFTN